MSHPAIVEGDISTGRDDKSVDKFAEYAKEEKDRVARKQQEEDEAKAKLIAQRRKQKNYHENFLDLIPSAEERAKRNAQKRAERIS